ncbi:MAG: SDR family NAD(P)-dependent oxidoreductase [Verrucomicrobia bacterium]|nr:SDR family NAD(P)-dependent oxidoreductase [Verrucomicrobiota bacterium]
MSGPLSRTVLITGASSGIGEATSHAFLAAGWTVHAAARRTEKMAGLEQAGARIHPLDLNVEGSIIDLARGILDSQGGVGVLVNNAGIGVYGAVEEVPLDEARRQFEVNLFGLARLTQLLLPSMRAVGGGTIVNVSSIGGRVYTPMGAWYHASKHALEGWSDCLRIEVAPFGIRVIVVEPGAIETEFAEIAIAPLLERSENGPYRLVAGKMAAATRRAYLDRKASSPDLIAALILRAVQSRKARTRYPAGHLARPVLWARRLLGDRGFDWMIRRFL